MRVIAGNLRGRRLEPPPGDSTRPITDRAKETLFNILGAYLSQPGTIPDTGVLDLFAGSGGLGIEALSRGARSCLFIEHDRRALRVLRENLARLGLDQTCRVSAENAWTMRIPALEGGYGLVFLDPPYREADDALRVTDLLERIGPNVAAGGLVVFRHRGDPRARLQLALRTLRCVDEREIGTMRLWFFAPA